MGDEIAIDKVVAKNPSSEVTLPADVAGMNFDVTQLPRMDNSDGGPASNEPEPKAAPTKETKSDKAEKVEEKTNETTKDKGEPKDKGQVSSVLKAPKTDKDKSKEEPEEEPITDGIKKISPPDKKVTGSQDTFDYSKYAPAEVELLKNMSRPAREHMSKVMQENKELSKLKEFNYLQHPHAYVLDPQFNEINNNLNKAKFEGDHWKQQLMLAKGGKKIRDIKGYDKQGNPVLSNEIDPTDEIEESIRLNMQRAHNIADNLNQEIQKYPSKYKNQIGNDLATINQERSQRFAWVADPKLLDYEVDFNGKDTSLKNIKSGFINLFPQYMRNHIGVETAADIYIAMVCQSAELNSLKQNGHIEKIKEEEREKVEPSSSVKPAKIATTVGDVKEFSMAGTEDLTGLQ